MMCQFLQKIARGSYETDNITSYIQSKTYGYHTISNNELYVVEYIAKFISNFI